ncbi:hypothetical protein DICPUDRAFT_25984 [Dictyostelium purpureum]|uniref:Transmembrane protein n=1 Tax=Dictyostelium purpureum TaxID=5786 RepID=F0Z7V9_DICPU|nr:uncharacterized protein DICPUDRAFT_25984 [Dictyostelium purpureum]EGC39975.1 hypothetical protein DICPUDRAFT_25984 [Dictyostelium purpureum]|eukprot:XP_003283478.1 hypothetical protein DICPUDRAFT_25984 [Dictyostelium purpureum]
MLPSKNGEDTVETKESDESKSPKSLKSMVHGVKETIKNDAIKNKSQRENENVSRKKMKSVSGRKTPFSGGFWVKLLKGVFCFIQGTLVTFKQEKVRKAFLSTLKIILFSVLASYLLVFFLTFPIRLFLIILSYFGLDLESIELDNMLETRHLIQGIAYFIPIGVIGILRYVLPSFNEDMFNYALESQDAKLSNFLKNSKVLKTYPLIGYLKRFSKLAVMGILVFVFSFIPYIGDFVLAVAQFYYSYQPLGQGSAFILSLLSLIPSTKSIAADILKTSMAANSLGKELLEVYFVKLPDVKQELYIYRRYYGWIFGFSFCWMFALRTPYIGSVFWGVAQASTSYLILKILQRNKLKVENQESDMVLLGQDELSTFETSPILTAKKLN